MDLEEKIKSENRQTTIKNIKEKLLTPAKCVAGKISSTLKRPYDKFVTYLQDKRKERNAVKRFREKWQKRYDEYLNAFDESRIGEAYDERVYGSDAGKPDTLRAYETTTYVTDHGNFTRRMKDYRGKDVTQWYTVFEYEGYVQDPNTGNWVYAVSESINGGWSEIYAREIVRQPNGKFKMREYYNDRNEYQYPEIYEAQVKRFEKIEMSHGADIVSKQYNM